MMTPEQMFALMEKGRLSRIAGEPVPSTFEAQTVEGWLKLHGWIEKNALLEVDRLRAALT